MNAGTPPTPTLPNTLLAPIMAPKTLDVQIAAKKGTFNGKFTPNIAGSVTPKNADTLEVNAKPSSLPFYVVYK